MHICYSEYTLNAYITLKIEYFYKIFYTTDDRSILLRNKYHKKRQHDLNLNMYILTFKATK